MPKSPEMFQWWRPGPATERELGCTEQLEVGDFEVYRRKLELACYEGRDIFMKMGVSPMIQGGDVCVGIYTASGDLATAVLGTHLHLINAQIAIKYAVKYFINDEGVGVKPGDMFYVNDATYGGIHNCDQIMYVPIFHEDELIAWGAAMAHETETGAIEPGGNPPSAKSRYDEGMRLAPFKVGENYRLRSDLVELMENFVRDPRMQTLDLRARAAICYTLERRVKEVATRKGGDFVIGLLRRMIESGREAAQRRIASFNDGTYRQTLFLDCVGAEKFSLVRVMVNLHKKGDKVTVDFTGSSPRVVAGNFNVLPHMMIAECACVFYQYLFPDLNPSIGVFAPFDFVFEKGSLFDPDPDDAISLGVMTIQNVNPAVHVAFQKMLVDSEVRNNVNAAWPGSSNAIAWAGLNQYGTVFSGWDQAIPNSDGMGAKHDMDGTDAAGFDSCPVGEFLDMEQVEMQYPLIGLFRSKYLKDAHGFGKYRGGRTVGGCYAFHNTAGGYAVSMAGHSRFPVSAGLFGGYAPALTLVAYVRNPNWKELAENSPEDLPSDLFELSQRIKGDWQVLHSCSSLQVLNEGDICFTAGLGGAGYGDVLERDPKLVMKDLEEDSISHWAAQKLYKVVYDSQTLQVDEDATAALRAQERQARIARGKTWDEFVPAWTQKKPKDEILGFYGSWPNACPA
ncbi:MAG: hypothetical protein EPO21_11185 [Chloroflexota bacterium]|nr:MAG: hypothetical protein EPO21_11185 [Chloroflexota bacterium]